LVRYLDCLIRLVVPTVSFLFAGTVTSFAQDLIDVCMKGGAVIRAIKVETRAGKFVLYPQGGGAPIEVGEDQVRGIAIPCGQPQAPAAGAAQKFGIYGSNTIGERLMPLLIDAYAQKTFGAKPVHKPRAPEEEEIEIRRSGSTEPLAVVDFQAKGSGTSAAALLAKNAVIGMSSRRANNEEVDKIRGQYQVELIAPGNEHVLALDGLAVIINQDNPIRQLALEQVARIFAGEVSNWKDVAYRDANGRDAFGPDRPIKLHARDNKSGTYDTFVALVLAPPGQPKRQLGAGATRYESSENLSDAVAKDPDAIGFIGLPYINKNHPLSIASACGLLSAPSRFTVKTEQYPLARRLFLYSIGTPDQPIARDILQFALSDAAQPTVTEAEFVDQAVEFQEPAEQREWQQTLVANPSAWLDAGKPVPPAAARQLDQALQRMSRSTVVFRFASNKSELDAKVVQDVDRLARYLQSPKVSGKRFLIVGFADSKGGWPANATLSLQRAARVADELRRLGATVPQNSVLGLSYMAPVSCNDSDLGQAKNRRVEIWIAQ
jgi:phosphate transport system substrate-binding protein